ETPAVVAEGGAGAAQPGREKFWKIDREATKEGELAKAHDRNHPKDVADGFKLPEHNDRADEGKHEGDGKCPPATKVVGKATEAIHPEEAADVEHHRRHGGPEIYLETQFRRWQTFL